jgi:hypothetical protein
VTVDGVAKKSRLNRAAPRTAGQDRWYGVTPQDQNDYE